MISPAALALLLVVGCGKHEASDAAPNGCEVTSTGAESKYVLNAITLPQQRTDFAIDLNGDGRLDNQLGSLVGALAANNLDSQASNDAVLAAGKLVVLLDENAADLMSDACGSATIEMGNDTAAAPLFDGTDSFTADTTFPGGAFRGPISASAFESESPAATTRPVSLSIKLVLFPGATPVRLDLVGAHLHFVRSDTQVTGGQLQGAIRQTEVQSSLVPALAASLNSSISADPMSPTSVSLLQVFDTGGAADLACTNTCRNPDLTCAQANDGVIAVCEVGTNAIIKNVLNPDVQLFDATGAYHPNPANTVKDSLSVGLGFTAVPASF